MERNTEETNHVPQLVPEDNGNDNGKGQGDPDRFASTTFLAELNLIIVLLSLFSMPNEECLGSDDEEKEREGAVHKNHEAPISPISRTHTKRWDIKEAKIQKPSTQRLQTTIRDFRHGKKM